MAYVNFKDLPRRTITDKILSDKAFNIVKNLKYNGYQCGLASMIYLFIYFFDKRFALLAQSQTLTTWGKSAFNKKRNKT